MTKDNVFGFVDDLQKLYDSIEDVRRIHMENYYTADEDKNK